MAAFDFPSSPSVNQTYTANGVTWKWNGTMWMRITGAGYLEKIEEGNSKIEVDDSGSGNITATTDGTERLRIRSDGKLMTQSAGYVYTASSGGSLSLYGGNTNLGGGIVLSGGNANGDIRFYAQMSTATPAERLRITSGGSVAIGVNSPSDKLHVGGNNAFIRVDRPNGNPGLTLIYNSTNSTRADIDVTTGGDLRFATNSSTERLRITSGGNVGVNVTNPLSDLQVITAGQTEDGTFRIGGSSTGLGLVLDYDQSSATVSRITANPTYTNTSSLLKICVDGDANSNQLVLKGDGKIGINNSSPPVRLAVHDSSNCKLLLSSSWSGTQEIIFGGGSTNSTGSGNSTAAKIIVQASAPGGAATGYMSFYTNAGDNIYERLRLTSEGNIWTANSAIMHGSGDITDFSDAGRTGYNNVSIRAGQRDAGTSPTNSNSAIKIYPAGVRSTTTGNLTGGIAWQHLDPNNSDWGTRYGSGSQIWMGAALHDTPGQERDRFNLWMNDQTSQGSQPNNLAIEAYPNGVVRHPKVPAFMVRNTTNSSAFAANTRANWNTVILNNGSHFDTTNNIFTAPVDGIYTFSCMMLSNSNTRLFHNFRVNNTTVEGTRSESHAVSGSFQTNTITMVYSLSANDYVDVYVRNNQGYGGNYTNFNGFLVG